jgi:glycosyltransferase involved in cell wall biosynthesis
MTHYLDAWRRLPADLDVLKQGEEDIRNFLVVGPVAPEEGHLDFINIFAYYHRNVNPRSRLFFVEDGRPRLETYERRIRHAIDQAGLRGFVILTGQVTTAQLKAYYLIAHAFLCASRQEGFCVALRLAMGFKIPCIAWTGTAADILGEEALVWEDLDPAVWAESLHVCLENREVSDYLVERQYARYKDASHNPA